MAKAKKKTTKKTPKKSTAVSKKAAKKVVAKKSAPKKSAKPAPKAKVKTIVKSAPAVKNINWSEFISPLDDRLIVSVEAAETLSPGGLVLLSGASSEGNQRGHVIAVGPGHRNKKGKVRPMDVCVGDRILFPEMAGTKIELLGQKVIILREADVLGIAE